MRKFFMLLLLGAALLFVFPPQLLHPLTCHADSIDSHLCGTEETSVGNQHHHCDILQLFFSPFHPERKVFSFSDFQFPFHRTTFESVHVSKVFFFSDKTRGPPSIS